MPKQPAQKPLLKPVLRKPVLKKRGGQRPDNVDRQGFRPNVGIVVHNASGQVLWAHRTGEDDAAWQFPQGGIGPGESPEQALYRELREETGLDQTAVEIRGCTKGWLRYRVPRRLRRNDGFRGQKQKWFLLRLLPDPPPACAAEGSEPEFDDFRWVSYWYPVGQVVAFKRDVYRRALGELAPRLRLREAAPKRCPDSC